MVLEIILELPAWLRRRAGGRLQRAIGCLILVAFLWPASPVAVPGRLLWCRMLESQYEVGLAALSRIGDAAEVSVERPEVSFPGC